MRSIARLAFNKVNKFKHTKQLRPFSTSPLDKTTKSIPAPSLEKPLLHFVEPNVKRRFFTSFMGNNLNRSITTFPKQFKIFPLFAGVTGLYAGYRLNETIQSLLNLSNSSSTPFADAALLMFEQAPFFKDMIQINPATGQLNKYKIISIHGAVPPTTPSAITIAHIKDKSFYEFEIVLGVLDNNDEVTRSLSLTVSTKSYANEFYDKHGIFHPFGVPEPEKNSYAANICGPYLGKIRELCHKYYPELNLLEPLNTSLSPLSSIIDGSSSTPVFHIVHLKVIENDTKIGYAIRFPESTLDPWGKYQSLKFHEYISSLPDDEKYYSLQRFQGIPRYVDIDPILLLAPIEVIHNRIKELEMFVTYQPEKADIVGSQFKTLVQSLAHEEEKIASSSTTTAPSSTTTAPSSTTPAKTTIQAKTTNHKSISPNEEILQLTKALRYRQNAYPVYAPANIDTTYDSNLIQGQLHYAPIFNKTKAFINTVIDLAQSIHDFKLREVVGDIFDPSYVFPQDISPFGPSISHNIIPNPSTLQYPLITSLQSLASDTPYVSHFRQNMQPLGQSSQHSRHLVLAKLSEYHDALLLKMTATLQQYRVLVDSTYAWRLPVTHELYQSVYQEALQSGDATPEMLEEVYNAFTPEQREEQLVLYNKKIQQIPQYPTHLYTLYDQLLARKLNMNLARSDVHAPTIPIADEKQLSSMFNSTTDDESSYDFAYFRTFWYETSEATPQIPSLEEIELATNAVLELEAQSAKIFAEMALSNPFGPQTPTESYVTAQLNKYELEQQEKQKQPQQQQEQQQQQQQDDGKKKITDYSIHDQDNVRFISVLNNVPFYTKEIIPQNDVNEDSKLFSQLNGLLLETSIVISPDINRQLMPLRGELESWDTYTPTFYPLSILPCAQWYPIYEKTAVEPDLQHSVISSDGSFGCVPNNSTTKTIAFDKTNNKNVLDLTTDNVKKIEFTQERSYSLQSDAKAWSDEVYTSTDAIISQNYIEEIKNIFTKYEIPPLPFITNINTFTNDIEQVLESLLQDQRELNDTINQINTTMDKTQLLTDLDNDFVMTLPYITPDLNLTGFTLDDYVKQLNYEIEQKHRISEQLPNVKNEISQLLSQQRPYPLPSTTIFPLNNEFGIENIDLNTVEINLRRGLFYLLRRYGDKSLTPDLKTQTLDDKIPISAFTAWNNANRTHSSYIMDTEKKTIDHRNISSWFWLPSNILKYTAMGLRLPNSNSRNLYGDEFIPKPIFPENQEEIIAKSLQNWLEVSNIPNEELHALMDDATINHALLFNKEFVQYIDPAQLRRFVLVTHDKFHITYDGTVWYEDKYPVGHTSNQFGRLLNGTPDQKLATSLGISNTVLKNSGQKGINPSEFIRNQKSRSKSSSSSSTDTLQKLYVKDDFGENTTNVFANGIHTSAPGEALSSIPFGRGVYAVLPLVGFHILMNAVPVIPLTRTVQCLPEVYNRIGIAKPLWFNPIEFAVNFIKHRSSKPIRLSLHMNPAKAPKDIAQLREITKTVDTEYFNTLPEKTIFSKTENHRSTIDFYLQWSPKTKTWIVDRAQLFINDVPQQNIEFQLPIKEFEVFNPTIPKFNYIASLLRGKKPQSELATEAVEQTQDTAAKIISNIPTTHSVNAVTRGVRPNKAANPVASANIQSNLPTKPDASASMLFIMGGSQCSNMIPKKSDE